MAIATNQLSTIRRTARVAWNPTATLLRPFRTLGSLVFGDSATPRRTEKRQGYPDHEFYQIITGHRDRFDGLM